MAKTFHGSCQKERFLFLRNKYGKLTDTEEREKFQLSNVTVYFPLARSMGRQREVMAEWQKKKKNSRGLSIAQPIIQQYVREKSKGQTKKWSVRNAIMEDMKLPTDKLLSQQ